MARSFLENYLPDQEIPGVYELQNVTNLFKNSTRDRALSQFNSGYNFTHGLLEISYLIVLIPENRSSKWLIFCKQN
jgi:hypothetical protein